MRAARSIPNRRRILMSEELSDYDKFAEPPLRFPYKGKVYELPEIGIEDGIYLAGVVSGRDKGFAKKEGVELWKLLCGSMWDEMVADGVPLNFATRVGLAVLADRTSGRQVAKIAWETGADPKALEPYLHEVAKAQGNRASRRSQNTGGANSTRKPASTKATKSPGRP
jgi:hypothetical protein